MNAWTIKKTDNLSCPSCILSDSNRIQTYNLLIRSQMLYSVELWSRCFLNCDAKVLLFFESTSDMDFFFDKNVNFSTFLLFVGCLTNKNVLLGCLLFYKTVVEHVPSERYACIDIAWLCAVVV